MYASPFFIATTWNIFLCCKRPSHWTSIVLGNNVSVALLHSPASALILQSALSKEITPLFQLRLLGNHCTTVLPPRLHAISFLIALVADCARFLNVIAKCVLVKHCESWIMHPTSLWTLQTKRDSLIKTTHALLTFRTYSNIYVDTVNYDTSWRNYWKDSSSNRTIN